MVIQEANTAAADLFGMAVEHMRGLLATVGIEASSRPAVDAFLATARTTGKAAEMRARIQRTGPTPLVALVDISATPFRAAVTPGADQLLLLVRARSVAPGLQDTQRRLENFVEHTPDAVVITDGSGRVQMANPAFLALCVSGMSSAQLHGRSLSDLLGDPGQRLPSLISEVRRNGIASQVRTLICKDGASTHEVEVSAALLAEGDHECIGLILRSRLPQDTGAFQHVDTLSEAIENLDAQLGRVSLPELMQEATHLAERHLIRCALQRSGGNHATAGSWLGISPESLTLRLQRNGLQATGDSSQLLN
jgi:PAS domain S-box-containing protein